MFSQNLDRLNTEVHVKTLTRNSMLRLFSIGLTWKFHVKVENLEFSHGLLIRDICGIHQAMYFEALNMEFPC